LMTETEYESRRGRVTRERQYGTDGLLEQETEYWYNEDGFLVREVLKEADGMVVEEKSWEPDQQQRVRSEFIHYADGSKDTVTHAYDADGFLVKKVTVDADGEVEQTEVFDYSDGLCVREAVYEGPSDTGDDVSSGLVAEKTFQYDGDGRLLETVTRDPGDDTLTRRVNEYDEKGHRVSVMVYDEKGQALERIQLKSDEKDRPVEVVEENRQKKNTTHLRYDDGGNVAFQEERDMSGHLVSKVERRYDEQGRLTESRVQMNMPVHGVSRCYVVRHEYEFFDGQPE